MNDTTVGISFGRYNPPHEGHIQVWKQMTVNDCWYVGTNPKTHNSKNPLPYEVKIKIMKLLYSDIDGHVIPESTWFSLADMVYKKHGKITLNIYTDEQWVIDNLMKYNGVNRDDGYYHFEHIIHVKTKRLSSATLLREAVHDNNREKFDEVSGVSLENYFDIVKEHIISVQ